MTDQKSNNGSVAMYSVQAQNNDNQKTSKAREKNPWEENLQLPILWLQIKKNWIIQATQKHLHGTCIYPGTRYTETNAEEEVKSISFKS